MKYTFQGQEGRRDLWFVKYLAIDPSYQRKGIGSALLNIVIHKVDIIILNMLHSLYNSSSPTQARLAYTLKPLRTQRYAFA